MFEYLASMNDSDLVVRIFCSVACAMMIAFITSKIIGPINKAMWFKKRERQSFFLRRGFIGEECHFGYPCTKEGAGVTVGMILVMALTTVVIFVV